MYPTPLSEVDDEFLYFTNCGIGSTMPIPTLTVGVTYDVFIGNE